jgi:hypothetical protein
MNDAIFYINSHASPKLDTVIVNINFVMIILEFANLGKATNCMKYLLLVSSANYDIIPSYDPTQAEYESIVLPGHASDSLMSLFDK